MLLADATIEQIGGGSLAGVLVTAFGMFAFRWYERRDKNAEKADAKDDKRRADTILEWQAFCKRLEERIDEAEAELKLTREAESRCGRRLERAEAMIEHLQEALTNANPPIKFRPYVPLNPGSGEHLPLPDRRGPSSTPYVGPERRKSQPPESPK